MTNAEMLRLRALQTAGLSVDEIAKKLGRTDIEVYEKLKYLGYQPKAKSSGCKINRIKGCKRYYNNIVRKYF